MNAPREQPATALDWTRANQQLLVAEFARLRALLGDGDAAQAAEQLAQARAEMTAPPAIDQLAGLFGLGPFERDTLLLCAGVDMDAALAAACARAAGNPNRAWVSFGLALATLTDPHWSALAPEAPLRGLRLVELDETAGLTTGRLRIDERILHYLAGLDLPDPRLQPVLAPVPPGLPLCPSHRAGVDALVAELASRAATRPLVMLSGNDGDGQRAVAVALAEAFGLGLMQIEAADLPEAAHEQHALNRLWRRESALLGCGLLIRCDGADGVPAPAIRRFLQRHCDAPTGLLVVAGRTRVMVDGDSGNDAAHLVVNRPEAAEQRLLWRAALGEQAGPLAATVDTLAGHYRFDARRIAALAADALETETMPRAQAGSLTDGDAARQSRRLRDACRRAGDGMPAFAQRIEPRAEWARLILPEPQREVLRQVVLHARHRLKVLHDWGFADHDSRGQGLAVLFWGDSGTGKTFAAEVLAHELGLALYRIDLSAVVSKYIGETEKNLRRLFDAAETLGAVLLFDEADALFGKRSEVRDSHDRYANIEVSYLLQRMETYCGIAVLTTNHRAALDGAFARRLRFVVHFPFPDSAQREAIWRVVFPAGVPLEPLDHARLANLAVPGGTIRSIALNAAFLAAEAGVPVGMAHLRRAVCLEATKREKTFSDAETRGWV